MKPKTYPKKEHGIEIRQIDPKALYILEKLHAANYEAYLVGGSVRDLLLHHPPKDFDISTSARPEEIQNLFPKTILIGKRFRLAHVHFGRKVIEVSTFRAGDIGKEELITEDNIWGTAEEDAIRRDFTINGLFYDSNSQSIIDFVEGYSDIQKKHLRVIGQPYLRFKQDPVRMIRCLKFKARFGLSMDKETELALIDCKKEIIKSAPARVLEELLRMLELGASRPFFQLLSDYGLLEQLIPEIALFLETLGGVEIYDFLQEADETIKETGLFKLKRPVLLSCLIFPILEEKLKAHFLDRSKIPHLGNIYLETSKLFDTTFAPFFRFPRRLKIRTINVLVSQYRITPFQKRDNKKIRIPNIPEFYLALQFLNLRCRLEPALQETAKLWYQHFTKSRKKAHPKQISPRNR